MQCQFAIQFNIAIQIQTQPCHYLVRKTIKKLIIRAFTSNVAKELPSHMYHTPTKEESNLNSNYICQRIFLLLHDMQIMQINWVTSITHEYHVTFV